MKKMINILLLITVLIVIYKYITPCSKTDIKDIKDIKKIEQFNTDKIYYNPPIESKHITFDYGERPIDKQFLKEQDHGVNLNTWYPNTWIESIDSNGKPIYNSRENVTKTVENFIESKARFDYKFDTLKTGEMSGVISPDDIKNNQGKSLKEIYDNSFVDFKKLVPKKQMLESEPDSQQLKAASNLSFLTPDTWVYADEKPENGGEIISGLYPVDPTTLGSAAIY
jgi:hypothetical protein